VPPIHAQVARVDLLSDRWLIEALSQLSSNPYVRDAAAAWLAAYTGALRCGCAEADAQDRADAALRRVVGAEAGPGENCVREGRTV
jgi:hypothetical protein